MARDRVKSRAFLILIGLAALSGSAIAIGNYKAAITFGRAASWTSATGGYPAVEGMLNKAGTPTWHYDGGTEIPMVLQSTGVVAATYTNANITVNQYGQVTAATPGSPPGAIPLVILTNTSGLTGALAASSAGNTIAIVKSTGGGWITYDQLTWSPLW